MVVVDNHLMVVHYMQEGMEHKLKIHQELELVLEKLNYFEN